MREPLAAAMSLACALNVFLGLTFYPEAPVVGALDFAAAAMCACFIIYRSGQR